MARDAYAAWGWHGSTITTLALRREIGATLGGVTSKKAKQGRAGVPVRRTSAGRGVPYQRRRSFPPPFFLAGFCALFFAAFVAGFLVSFFAALLLAAVFAGFFTGLFLAAFFAAFLTGTLAAFLAGGLAGFGTGATLPWLGAFFAVPGAGGAGTIGVRLLTGAATASPPNRSASSSSSSTSSVLSQRSSLSSLWVIQPPSS